MPSRTEQLSKKKLAQPPKWMEDGAVILEIINGSYAYGCSTDTSDLDIYGVCVPPKGIVFPHTQGYIQGYDKNIPTFEQYQEHGIKDQSAHGGKGQEYDLNIFNILKFCRLAADNNPNIIDVLYAGQHCVLHCTQAGTMLRNARSAFIHKGLKQKYIGYAHSQLHKMGLKTPEPGSKRDASVQQYGYDVKYATHLVRLIGYAEQLLTTGDLNMALEADRLKAIRNGEWTEQQIKDFFTAKETSLEQLYVTSQLPRKPDEAKIKQLILDILEHHYGNISDAFHDPGEERRILTEIKSLCEKAGI